MVRDYVGLPHCNRSSTEWTPQKSPGLESTRCKEKVCSNSVSIGCISIQEFETKILSDELKLMKCVGFQGADETCRNVTVKQVLEVIPDV